MTNKEWIKNASDEELASELKKIAHWNRDDLAKAEFHYENFYLYWLSLERGTQYDG